MEKVVLLVDDEERLRKGLERHLEDLDFKLLEAGSGEEALKIVSEKKVDIILTDLLMPEMGGLEFLQKLREWEIKTPVIAMSGGDAQEQFLDAGSLLKNAERYGALEVIEKPFSVELLVEIIDRLLGNEAR